MLQPSSASSPTAALNPLPSPLVSSPSLPGAPVSRNSSNTPTAPQRSTATSCCHPTPTAVRSATVKGHRCRSCGPEVRGQHFSSRRACMRSRLSRLLAPSSTVRKGAAAQRARGARDDCLKQTALNYRPSIQSATLVDQSHPPSGFRRQNPAGNADCNDMPRHGVSTFQHPMLPTIFRLVSNRSAAASKPVTEQPIAPRLSCLSELRRHQDASVTLDGHLVLPSHAERQAQLR